MEQSNVISRLRDFGYEYDVQTDSHGLSFAIEKVEWHIKNATNQPEVPEGLLKIAIDMACAEFLQIKKGFGQLTEIEFESVAKSVSMGDTSVSFADGASPEQKFDATINYLLTGHEEDFLRYRKMVW